MASLIALLNTKLAAGTFPFFHSLQGLHSAESLQCKWLFKFCIKEKIRDIFSAFTQVLHL